jgi:hypothetical protein
MDSRAVIVIRGRDEEELRGVLAGFDQIEMDDYDPSVLSEKALADSNLYVIAELFKTLKEKELYFLPPQELKNISKFAETALELFRRAQAPKIDQAERIAIIDGSEKLYESCFGTISSVIVFSVAKSFDPLDQERKGEKLIEKLEAKNDDASKLLSTIKESLQKVTVADEAVHFQTEADRHKRAAYGWLAAGGLIAVVTLSLAWTNYSFSQRLIGSASDPRSATLTPALSIQSSFAKFLLFSLLIGGIIWCGRVYRAHRHNYVINKHRQNALGTFNTFVSSAQDQQTKGAVLLQATQCIFAPQPTGYFAQESDASGYPQIVEIVRSAIENKTRL